MLSGKCRSRSLLVTLCGRIAFMILSVLLLFFFFFSSRRRHTRWTGDWSSDVCSSDLDGLLRTARPDPARAPRGERGLLGAPPRRVLRLSRREAGSGAAGGAKRVERLRSEERRGGEEGRSRGGPEH